MILKKNFKKCMGIGDGEESGRCLLIDLESIGILYFKTVWFVKVKGMMMVRESGLNNCITPAGHTKLFPCWGK